MQFSNFIWIKPISHSQIILYFFVDANNKRIYQQYALPLLSFLFKQKFVSYLKILNKGQGNKANSKNVN